MKKVHTEMNKHNNEIISFVMLYLLLLLIAVFPIHGCSKIIHNTWAALIPRMAEHVTLINSCFNTVNSPNEDFPPSCVCCRALATSILSAKAINTSTSFATTTDMTSDVKGPFAPTSLMTAIAEAGDLAIDNVAMREAKVRVDEAERERSREPRRGMS